MRSARTMRGFWAVLAASAVAGLLGGWWLWDAAEQYTGALRTYSQLTVAYQPDSFVWIAPDYSRARTTVVVTNDSPSDATVQSIDLHLLIDGQFAGSNYATFYPLTVPRGESQAVEVELEVTTTHLRPRGGEAPLALGGDVVARFPGIERALALRVRASIGQVNRVED